MLASVIRFMCGHRLQGRTNSMSGYCSATLSLIEHSVTSTTRAGRSLADIVHHGGRRARKVSLSHHLGRAFRMSEHHHAGMSSRAARGCPPA